MKTKIYLLSGEVVIMRYPVFEIDTDEAKNDLFESHFWAPKKNCK